MSIHPLAVVSPLAQIGPGVEIGPFCIVEPTAVIGPDTILESRVVVKSGTTIGARNHIFEGAVIGGLPQHVHIPERPGKVCVGNDNVIRENVTIHRALDENETTILGDHCFLMVNAHVAHDCHVGSNVIMTNNAMVGGHVSIGDRAYISGGVAIHQFCRIGTMAMLGGQAHVVQDVPPYVTVDGLSSMVVGLNQVGLRRAGYDVATIKELKRAYRVIYRSGLMWKDMLEMLRQEFTEGLAAEFPRFLEGTKRGILSERRLPPNATLKIKSREEDEKETQSENKHSPCQAQSKVAG